MFGILRIFVDKMLNNLNMMSHLSNSLLYLIIFFVCKAQSKQSKLVIFLSIEAKKVIYFWLTLSEQSYFIIIAIYCFGASKVKRYIRN